MARDDLQSANVKKLAPTEYFRAKLDHSNRLLFQRSHHDDNRYALIIEVIRNHEYEKSRFLRGVRIDEDKIPPFSLDHTKEHQDSHFQPISYVNAASTKFHILDKPLSFDETQSKLFRLPSPLIIIGSAGSGKTALTLEKLKRAKGDVLYITLSAFLAKNARDLYFSNHYENESQNIDFLSCLEFLDTLRYLHSNPNQEGSHGNRTEMPAVQL